MSFDPEYIRRELASLGLIPQTADIGGVIITAEMRNSELRLRLDADSARVEVVLMEGAPHNKVGLLNIVHHNNNYFPFGQCYIAPEGYLAFGFVLPAESAWRQWFKRIVYELAVSAEAYANLLLADFEPLPFDVDSIDIDLRKVLNPGLAPPQSANTLDAGAAVYLVERALTEKYGKSGVIRMGEMEFAMVGEYIVNISLEPHSFLRKHSLAPDWFAAVRIDVGVLELVDNKLWVIFNKWNHGSFMISHGLRYENRKPVVTLRTELPGDFVQRPSLLEKAVEQATTRADFVFSQLSGYYNIQQAIDYNLGLDI